MSEIWEKTILSARAEEPLLPPAEATESSASYGLPATAESLADRLAVARMKAGEFLDEGRRESVAVSQRALHEFRQRVRRMKEERPMALVGIIAGSAFVLGMTLRIWRSRR